MVKHGPVIICQEKFLANSIETLVGTRALVLMKSFFKKKKNIVDQIQYEWKLERNLGPTL